MQTLKFIIHGSFYDSQIYSGRLYLWSNAGSIITIDWDRLVECVNVNDRLKLALRCAYQQSEYLYGSDFKLFFQDEEIKKVIQRKFADLSELKVEFTETDLRRRKLVIAEQDNPLPFPHADSLIYNNTLYVGSPSGLSATTLNKRNKKPINPDRVRLWDSPVLGVAASYLTLALAAGNEGLFQCPYYSRFSKYDNEPSLVSTEHSNSARWMYASIFSSSYFNGGYLADFVLEEIKDTPPLETDGSIGEGGFLEERINISEVSLQEIGSDENNIPKPTERKLREIVPFNSIFDFYMNNGNSVYTWGVHDKICLAKPGYIEVVQYSPYRGLSGRFQHLGRVETFGPEPFFAYDSEQDHSNSPGDIVRGDSALFGYVLEFDNGLLVIDSDVESSTWMPGEPVNWRVFPKSKFYTNQLHIIYEDNLCIHSFNQDYFVDQGKKRVGIRHSQAFSPQGFKS